MVGQRTSLRGMGWRRGVLGLAGLVALAGCHALGDAVPGDATGGPADEISRVLAQGQALAVDPAVDDQLAGVAAEARRGVVNGDRDIATAQLSLLKDMNERLAQEYDVRVVSRPDSDTGFFRQSVDNPSVRNYYLVVEALAPDGRVLPVSVTSIETQKTDRVTIWAQRVNKEKYDHVRAEKAANGMVVDSILGHKTRGKLDPVFDEPGPGGAITDWDD